MRQLIHQNSQNHRRIDRVLYACFHKLAKRGASGYRSVFQRDMLPSLERFDEPLVDTKEPAEQLIGIRWLRICPRSRVIGIVLRRVNEVQS